MTAPLFRLAVLASALVLIVSCSAFQSLPQERGPDYGEIRRACTKLPQFPQFGSEFSAILSRLLSEAWRTDGDWSGDLQGDATFFAPVLLYALWKDTGNPVFRIMADRTVEYEKRLTDRFFLLPDMDMVIGFPVLAESYRSTGDRDSLDRYLSGVRKGSAVAACFPGFFTPFVYDRASVYGAVGTMTLQAYELSGDESFRKKGLELIAAADHSCWNAQEGLYAYEELADWPQATMLIALVRAYRATGEKPYLEQCGKIVASLDERYLDRENGGYCGDLRGNTKGLSGNNSLAWAFLDLLEATGDRAYLERARSVLKWILSDDLYDRRTGVIYHHWDKKPGRSDRTCTGCNFHTLCVIYRLNALEGRGIRVQCNRSD